MNMVVREGKRLQIPDRDSLPPASQGFTGLDAYEGLIRQCWAQDPADRPTFGKVIPQLW
jgi:hypothetical protein